jgi:FkbM family methyltransferase
MKKKVVHMPIKIVKKLLGCLDIRVSRLSAVNKYELANRSREVSLRIGTDGATEVLSYYLNNIEHLMGDLRLLEFMAFYSKLLNKSSSQWSQDIFVMYVTGLQQGGKYLEIGGADGFTHSNTISLEKYFGWSGTLVEPDPEQFEILRSVRSGNTLINAAISPAGVGATLELRQVGQLSAVVGYEPVDMHEGTRKKSHQFKKVDGIPLQELLANSLYDYFSLDVEGAELTILESLKWDEIIKPKIITVEHNFRPADRRDLIDLLNRQGYKEWFADYDWLRRGDIWVTQENRGNTY